MSNIQNEAKITFPLVTAVRGQLEQRAAWLYLLCDEARKRGLDPRDFGSAAIRRCGLGQGKYLVKEGGTTSLKGLRKTLFSKPAQRDYFTGATGKRTPVSSSSGLETAASSLR